MKKTENNKTYMDIVRENKEDFDNLTRCADFLKEMIEKYGDQILLEEEKAG